MDHRMALRPQTPLRFYKRNGEVIQCAIEQEIGRGGSCIVYEVSREAETGDITLYRLKELYPYKMNIKRDYEGELIISDDEKSAFVQQQKQFDSDYSLANKLFYSGKNYSSTVNYLDIYYLNGTSYSLSTYSSKNTLATYKPETLKECISLVKHVAYVLNNVHKEGYLYLDTKPDNILVVDGLEKQIQLFDFNSLVSLSELKKMNERKNGEIRLSFTKGFAPIELQTSKIKKLGPHTDVFGVGALLFYLIFGATPCASDCETDAILDYTNIRFGDSRYDDKLFQSLTEFFNNALAIYYGDRYQSMDEAYEKLEEIEKFADITRPCIFSTEIIRPNFVFGRELDFEKLDQYLCDDTYNCTFITGMGGIGKSTFIREY